MTGGGSSEPRRLAMRFAEAGAQGPDLIPVVADVGSGAAAIEIEIGSAIVRVRAGVDPALLGKVLRLLKAMK